MSARSRWHFLLLKDEYGEGPLWNAIGGTDAQSLHLSPGLGARLESWQDHAALLAGDAENATPHDGAARHELTREGAALAAEVADEMGRGVVVYFGTQTFESRTEGTNADARAELERFAQTQARLQTAPGMRFTWKPAPGDPG